jgi:hypothetical protein
MVPPAESRDKRLASAPLAIQHRIRTLGNQNRHAVQA